MAKNDALLLDGIVDDRINKSLPSGRRDEVFEYLAFEQLLKDYDLSSEEILCGAVDGRNDGGIDGFFIFINGHLLVDPESFVWPRSGSKLEVWVITCKHHDTFKQAPLDSLVASVSELFDLSLTASQLKGDYSDSVIKARENLKYAYRKVSPRLSSFSINYSYTSRGDTDSIGDSIKSRSEQVVSITKESFGACDVSFEFHGSTELVELHRKMPNFCLELPYSKVLGSGERYVLLASLKDYYRFVSDNGKLRRYLFDSNVRDFMGLNRVNEDIRDTLNDEFSPDFWWLNNGVTILATSANVIGDSIQIQDIQIVNGLQTTESIFRYFESGGEDPKSRLVLIKVIVSQDDDIRDRIIRATNNQTDVELASLHATDKIQRDIEDILERAELYYERRKNFHSNMGHPSSKIVTPLYLASGYVNLIIKSPQKASALRARFMRSDESYNNVFSEKTPIEIWPKIAFILKITDSALEKYRPIGSAGNERFLKKWRQITSLITVSRLIGSYGFSPNDLVKFDLDSYTHEEIDETWEFISRVRPNDLTGKKIKSKRYFTDLCIEAAEKFSIDNANRIERGDFNANGPAKKNEYKKSEIVVDMDFALKVNALLPEQPWKPGIHRNITKELNCSNKEYFQAVQLLIEEGYQNRQLDGVVYDTDGNVITFDPERVNPATMELYDVEGA
ncbi:AIPR family protein [Methylobacter sp.]|uniref:AIPR family protein n=1 Tax=Methylobacter sp. TaxID=2051955 RepID=UPI003DA56B02